MSLKEIKERINSVQGTRKTTSAMKMVSSAKLHKAQRTIENMLPYSKSLHNVMEPLLSGGFSSELCTERAVSQVAIVVFSSDSSLCGAYNANIIHEALKAINQYKNLPPENIHIYTIGKKVYDAIRKEKYKIEKNLEGLAAKPNYNTIADLADLFIQQFKSKEIDRVEMIYHHFKSTSVQELMHETILPLKFSKPQNSGGLHSDAYIYEPSSESLLNVLLPKSIKLSFYTALLDSNASEHAARMLAMQTATDNADDLINELSVEYNKSRQQAITSELLDLIAGSMGK